MAHTLSLRVRRKHNLQFTRSGDETRWIVLRQWENQGTQVALRMALLPGYPSSACDLEISCHRANPLNEQTIAGAIQLSPGCALALGTLQ